MHPLPVPASFPSPLLITTTKQKNCQLFREKGQNGSEWTVARFILLQQSGVVENVTQTSFKASPCHVRTHYFNQISCIPLCIQLPLEKRIDIQPHPYSSQKHIYSCYIEPKDAFRYICNITRVENKLGTSYMHLYLT